MKKLFFILLMLGSICSFAQDETATIRFTGSVNNNVVTFNYTEGHIENSYILLKDSTGTAKFIFAPESSRGDRKVFIHPENARRYVAILIPGGNAPKKLVATYYFYRTRYPFELNR